MQIAYSDIFICWQLSRRNFYFHTIFGPIFNASSRGSRYKLIFSSLEIIELIPQTTVAHVTIVKIIFTKFFYRTIIIKLYFQENYSETILLSQKTLSFERNLSESD